MSDPFLGEIRAFGFPFAPRGWAMCNGQTIPINQNTALFSILGVTYGGDGRTTFGLPDLRARVPIGQGQGAGLGNQPLGALAGSAQVTLNQSNIPTHNHALGARAAASQTATPANAVLANGSWVQGSKFGGVQQYATGVNPTTALAPDALRPTGGSSPHNNLMPYQAQNYCIALVGVFPQRQ